MKNIIELEKEFILKGTKTEIADKLKKSFKRSLMRFGRYDFYILSINESDIILSDTGIIETKIILEVDEKTNLVRLKTDSIRNHYIFIFVLIMYWIFMWSADEMDVSPGEAIITSAILVFIMFIADRMNKAGQLNRIIVRLKEFNLIE